MKQSPAFAKTAAAIFCFLAIGAGAVPPTGPVRDILISNGADHAIMRFDGNSGSFLGYFVAISAGGMVTPQGIAIGSDGNIYVADSGRNVVSRYSGVTGAYIDDFVAAGFFSSPTALKFGPDGYLYVLGSGTGKVYRFNPWGIYDGIAANGSLAQVSAGRDFVFLSNATANILDVVAISGNHKGARFNTSTGAFINYFLNPTTDQTLIKSPRGIFFGPDGNLWVGNFGLNKVTRFSASTGAKIDDFVSGGSLLGPSGLLIANNVLYVVNRTAATVRRYNATTGVEIPGFFIGVSEDVNFASPDYICFAPPVDTDGDKMDDHWELANGLSYTNAADAALDADGDGQRNSQEYVAGTDPNNVSSGLRITDFAALGAGGARITFQSVPGKAYRLLTAPDLTAWSVVQNNIIAISTSTELIYPQPTTNSARHFKLEVVKDANLTQ